MNRRSGLTDVRTIRLPTSQVRRIARALAEPRRMEMLEQIATYGESIACQRLSELHDISAPTLSHHIKELETAGLITITRRGRNATLIFQPGTLRAYLNEFAYLTSADLTTDTPRGTGTALTSRL